MAKPIVPRAISGITRFSNARNFELLKRQCNFQNQLLEFLQSFYDASILHRQSCGLDKNMRPGQRVSPSDLAIASSRLLQLAKEDVEFIESKEYTGYYDAKDPLQDSDYYFLSPQALDPPTEDYTGDFYDKIPSLESRLARDNSLADDVVPKTGTDAERSLTYASDMDSRYSALLIASSELERQISMLIEAISDMYDDQCPPSRELVDSFQRALEAFEMRRTQVKLKQASDSNRDDSADFLDLFFEPTNLTVQIPETVDKNEEKDVISQQEKPLTDPLPDFELEKEPIILPEEEVETLEFKILSEVASDTLADRLVMYGSMVTRFFSNAGTRV